jgi:UDP-N-acetyl-D-mannosaminuronate dehydrogenase
MMDVVVVVGLGYVGLPLMVEFAKVHRTIGFDIVPDKVAKCRAGTDPPREIPDSEESMYEYGVRLIDWNDQPPADAIVATVAHRSYQHLGVETLARKVVGGGCFFDVKAGLTPRYSRLRACAYGAFRPNGTYFDM